MRSPEISGDAVTADLRTKDNALSFWECGDAASDELERVALALATAGDRLDKVELAWTPVEELESADVKLQKTPGRTLVTNMIECHVDACEVDLERLCSIATSVSESLDKDRYHRFTKAQVRAMIKSAIANGALDSSGLPEKIQAEL